nr:M15 family metallopeptidase [uncultured Oscillibacter sp.]
MNRKFILAGAAAFALAALALAAAYFYIPGGVRPSFEEGDVRVCLNEDGTILLDWPEARLEPLPVNGEDGGAPAEEDGGAPQNAVCYDLDVQSGDRHVQKLQSSPGVLLDSLTLPMTVRVQAVVEGKNLLGMPRRLTSQTLIVEVADADLSAPEAVGTPGPGSLALSWKQPGQVPELYEVFSLEDGVSLPVASTSEKQVDLKVRKTGGDLALPGYDHPLEIHVWAAVRGEGYLLCGPASNGVRVERQDLLGDDLNLVSRETEPLAYTLEWDETRGEYYELQEWSPEGWTLLETLDPAESFAYELGRLGSGSHHRFQVVAKDRNGTVRSSEEAEFFASIDPLYATIWPIIDQPFYEKADSAAASLGKIPGGTALCVLEESGDWFQVRYQDQYGWVDSRFCMINLPEYVGDHCSYDITNSYRSVFKVHENPIALITDQVVKGFEHIQEEDGQFVVPYLYPCAKKLLSAAQAAEADGYRLKIYEAFRPNEATRFLYDTTAEQLEWAALVYDEVENEDGTFNALDPVTGWVVDLADGLLIDPETDEKISREDLALRQAEEAEEAMEEDGVPSGEGLMLGAVVPETGEPPQETPPDPSQPFFALPEDGEGGSLDPAEAPQPVPQPESEAPEGEPPESEGDEEPEYETYFWIMTNNGQFSLGSFLARVASAHNRGIALDLTLEKIDSGEELAMQSAIHDLSWYSAAYLNNDNAKLLEKYMTATGMRGLSSEWWHFQDDETREAIGLTSYLFKGVDLSGWTRDSRGWRYRNADGSVYKNTTFTVDGKRYTADQDGYSQQT